MCEVVDKFVQRGREQGIKEGIKEGIREGMKEGLEKGMWEEKIRGASAFVKESVLQKQSKEYIKGMLQTCFQLKEEEADMLYREGYEREHGTKIPAFT